MDKETLSKIFIIMLVSFLFTVPAQSKPGLQTSRKSIVIDPGHGGNDYGIETTAGLIEKKITLKLSLALSELLKNKYQVFLTREQDIPVSNVSRVSFANEHNTDLYISIHMKKSSADQGSIFYFQHPIPNDSVSFLSDDLWENQFLRYLEGSRTFAGILLEIFSSNIEKSKFLIFPAAIYPFSGCRMPAVLLEPFSLKTLPVRQKEQEAIINIYAELIYNGIEKYFKNNN